MVLVHTENDSRILVAEMIDEAVMKSAIARARVKTDIANTEAPQHLRSDVTAPGDAAVGTAFQLIESHSYTLSPSFRRGKRAVSGDNIRRSRPRQILDHGLQSRTVDRRSYRLLRVDCIGLEIRVCSNGEKRFAQNLHAVGRQTRGRDQRKTKILGRLKQHQQRVQPLWHDIAEQWNTGL